MSVALRLCLAVALVVLAGCEQTFRDMYDQAKYRPLAPSPLWADGRAARSPVEGTVPRSEGSLAGSTSGRLGAIEPPPATSALDAIRDELRTPAATVTAGASLEMPPITPQLLARGRERFDIFCSPCHSIVGDGDGMVARRGFPHPPSFHTDRLRAASDAHFYAVISDGYGAMYPYATRVPPSDRLAIIAYIRALQLSQHAPLARLGDEDRLRLASAPPSRRPSR
ncbi:MAG TPA: cytochrome c [Casimicrobiaceae bacterium]|nr:cytochrome c [Casimicrobiaceae bacterium]